MMLKFAEKFVTFFSVCSVVTKKESFEMILNQSRVIICFHINYPANEHLIFLPSELCNFRSLVAISQKLYTGFCCYFWPYLLCTNLNCRRSWEMSWIISSLEIAHIGQTPLSGAGVTFFCGPHMPLKVLTHLWVVTS